MIDPKLLTPENGFVPGGVVQYKKHLGQGVDYLFLDGPYALDFKSMTHIRPLTGPMAIWNFAGKATHLAMVNNRDTGNTEQLCWWEPDSVDFDEWVQVWTDFGAEITARPFWVKE